MTSDLASGEISLRSSLIHLTSGAGFPLAWHRSRARLPSRTVTSSLVPDSTKEGGTLTSRCPTVLRIGAELIWHMYRPWSRSITGLECP